MQMECCDRANVISLKEYRMSAQFPVISEVEAYWHALRDGQTVPERAQLDPRGLERALSHAFILERVAPGVARFRVSGTHLNALMGMEVRGMPLSAFFTGKARPALADHLEAMFSGPCKVHLTLSAECGIGRPALQAEVLLLPLRNESGLITRALGCLASDGRIGTAPRRFRIAQEQSHVLCGAETRALPVPARPVAGLAEAERPFRHEKGPDGTRPALRLVKTDR